MLKRIFIFAFLLLPFAFGTAGAAITITKAAPVADAPSSSGTAGAASLASTVLGLVTDVAMLNKQQKELTAECVPTSAEITFINNTVKEWAKTGRSTSEEVSRALGRESCGTTSCYASEVMRYGATAGMAPGYNSFVDTSDIPMIWYNFPMAGRGSYCKNGMVTGCAARDRVELTDAYDIFNLVDFGPADYLSGEATMAARLLDKTERCSNAVLSAKKRAMWGEFLQGTVGNIGGRTNTGAIMEQVSALQSTGVLGGLQSLGGFVTNIVNK